MPNFEGENFLFDDWEVFVIRRCAIGELKLSQHKHATVVNMVRHVNKNQRSEAKKVIHRLIKAGFLEKHRTDTFQWSPEGIELAKKILGAQPPSLILIF